MPSKPKAKDIYALGTEWLLPPSVTLGSSVRAKGVLLEIRARLPSTVRKSLDIEGATLVLRMPEERREDFVKTSASVATNLQGIDSLMVVPREIQDILSISTTERHRWLKDGRLPSAGTRTVKLRGRAKKITFHVFDPRRVEEILDRDLVSEWRETDAVTAAENRRRAAWNRRLIRQTKIDEVKPRTGTDDSDTPKLLGWDDFERNGPLREA